MQIFRDLFIRGPSERRAAALAEIERSLNDGWFRDRETEGRLASIAFPAGESFCFGCFGEGGRPAATVILTSKDPDMLVVSNVIPHARRRLDHEQYNRVLT